MGKVKSKSPGPLLGRAAGTQGSSARAAFSLRRSRPDPFPREGSMPCSPSVAAAAPTPREKGEEHWGNHSWSLEPGAPRITTQGFSSCVGGTGCACKPAVCLKEPLVDSGLVF